MRLDAKYQDDRPPPEEEKVLKVFAINGRGGHFCFTFTTQGPFVK